MIKVHPRDIVTPFVVTVLISGIPSTVLAALFDSAMYSSFDREFHLPYVGFGVFIGVVSGLAVSLYMRPITLQVSFNENKEWLSKVVEIALSGAGYHTRNEDGSLLVRKHPSLPAVLLWEMRVQVEQDTVTIAGPVPLAIGLKNSIEVATSVARWVSLLGP